MGGGEGLDGDPHNREPVHDGDGKAVASVRHRHDTGDDRNNPCGHPTYDYTTACLPNPTKVAGKPLLLVLVPPLTTGQSIVAHAVRPDCDPR
jgi:hypothetical protein